MAKSDDMSFATFVKQFNAATAGMVALENTQVFQDLTTAVNSLNLSVQNSNKLTQKDVGKITSGIAYYMKSEHFDSKYVDSLSKKINKEVSEAIKAGVDVSKKLIEGFYSRKLNEDRATGILNISSQQKKSSSFAANVDKEFKKDIVKQEDFKQLKTPMEKIHYLMGNFFEDMKSSEPRKRKRFIDDLVDALGAKKTVMGVVTDIFKLLSLMSANWLRKFGTLGKIIGTALVLFGPTLGIVLGKALLNVMTKAFVGLFSFLGRSVIKVFNMGVPFGNFGKMSKAGTAAQTGAKALGRTGIKASQLTRTVPQSTSALRSAIMFGGASAMGAGAGAKVFKVTSGAGTLAQKLGSPAMTKAATKAGGKVAAKAGGRFAALIPGAAVASGAALTALSGKMAWDSFKEGDMVGGAAFGVSTVASLVQMLAGNIPGIGTAVSAIAGVVGFIADMIGIFHKEIGEFIKGFWDNFKNTILSSIKGLWEGIKDFFSKSGLFGQPAGAQPLPAIPANQKIPEIPGVEAIPNNMSTKTINGIKAVSLKNLGLKGGGSNPYIAAKNAPRLMQLHKTLTDWGYDVTYTSAMGGRHAEGWRSHGAGAKVDFVLSKNGKRAYLSPQENQALITAGFWGGNTGALGWHTMDKSKKKGWHYDASVLYAGKENVKSVGTPIASSQSTDLKVKKEEPKKAETPKENKPVKVAEEPNKSTQVLQGSFPQGTSNAQAPALPKVDFSGTRTASNILNGVTNIVNVGADAAYQIV